ncbi:glycerate kinase [Beijerinckia mobilis]|uniref:glycerate kinase n=1 Tax=Beijerinckia mobilis TaxID=231434 RepID=UPI00054FE769|nr:glycerate kinase [Beijerinckia mobilis]
MKIVIAPDSFKESLSALQVAKALEGGFREIYPDADYVTLPMADGGEGTVEALVAATGGQIHKVKVRGPLGPNVDAFYGMSGDGRTAVIEMAAAAGLALIAPSERDPTRTTTYGVGELICAALDRGARHLIVGLGGSATNDGGAGLIQALGVRLLDENGKDLSFGGGALAELARIDATALDSRLASCRIEVACDVDNPLIGPRGASAIFGPQKGATPDLVKNLDANLSHYACCIKRDLGVAIADIPGAGAAGGLGAAFIAFLGAELRPGIDIIMKAVGFEAIVADADLVITGEGRIDSQTIHGKTPIGIARVAKRYGKPVIAIAGSLGADVDIVHGYGIDAVFSILYRICSLEEALAETATNLHRAARNIASATALLKRVPG